MPKRIRHAPIIGASDIAQLGVACREQAARTLKDAQSPYYVTQTYAHTEKDANANTWLVVRMRVRDSRSEVDE